MSEGWEFGDIVTWKDRSFQPFMFIALTDVNDLADLLCLRTHGAFTAGKTYYWQEADFRLAHRLAQAETVYFGHGSIVDTFSRTVANGWGREPSTAILHEWKDE